MTREDRWRGKEVKEGKGKGEETEMDREDKTSPDGAGKIGMGAAGRTGPGGVTRHCLLFSQIPAIGRGCHHSSK